MVIIDASVAIKWIFDEEGHEKAKALLSGESLGASDLLYYEFANFLSRQMYLSKGESGKILDAFYNFPVEYFLLPKDRMSRAVDLARQFSISAYDASYVALAEGLQADFVTADKKLVRKVRSLSFIRSLDD